MAQDKLGLETKDTKVVVQKLNELLANYQVFYMNVRGFHWNITGEKFFELHVKFEELYTDLLVKIDEIAERILTLGYTPLHTYSDYLTSTTVKEVRDVSDGMKASKHILDSLRTLVVMQREISETAGDNDDEGTNDLLSAYIREQEKIIWMYSAFLK